MTAYFTSIEGIPANCSNLFWYILVKSSAVVNWAQFPFERSMVYGLSGTRNSIDSISEAVLNSVLSAARRQHVTTLIMSYHKQDTLAQPSDTAQNRGHTLCQLIATLDSTHILLLTNRASITATFHSSSCDVSIMSYVNMKRQRTTLTASIAVEQFRNVQ
jgi:hypothetical protein